MTESPHLPNRGGPKNVNWLRGRTMFIAGDNITTISRALAVSRQTVSTRAAAEGWYAMRDANLTLTRQKISEQAVDDTAAVLKRHDAYGSKLFAVAEAKLAELMADGCGVTLKQLHVASAIGKNAAELQRAARGIRADETFVPKDDKPFVIELQRAPDGDAFAHFIKAMESMGVDRPAALEAWRRATEVEADLNTA